MRPRLTLWNMVKVPRQRRTPTNGNDQGWDLNEGPPRRRSFKESASIVESKVTNMMIVNCPKRTKPRKLM